jgi:drug/metabolite transporter (DMT)-like permease
MTRRGLLLFAAMCVIWGIPYLLIRVAVRELTPATLVFARTSIGALVLLPIAAMNGGLRPLVGRSVPVLAFAGIEIALPWVLLSHAETHLSSSLTGLLIAAVPLVGAVITRTTGSRERLGSANLLGLGLGLVGVGALVGLDLGGASAVALVEIAVVAVCYATGPIILSRYLGGLSSLGVIAVSLGVCALVYGPVAAFELPSRVPSWKATSSVLVLAVICSALAFVLFFALIAEIGPVRATVITYVNPAVAAVLGVTVLSEAFTVGMGVGFALILVGSVLATRAERAAAGFEAEPLAATAER